MTVDLTWPRDVEPMETSGLEDPLGARQRAQSRAAQLRTQDKAGVEWDEWYPPLNLRRAAHAKLYQTIRYAAARNKIVGVTMPIIPGSGLPPNGAGEAGVVVDGAGQTGDTLDLTGFSGALSPAIAAGDVFRVAGITRVFWAAEDADSDAGGNATVKLMIPIFNGNSPTNGASVTLTGVEVEAIVWARTPKPKSTRVNSLGGIKVTFVENLV